MAANTKDRNSWSATGVGQVQITQKNSDDQEQRSPVNRKYYLQLATFAVIFVGIIVGAFFGGIEFQKQTDIKEKDASTLEKDSRVEFLLIDHTAEPDFDANIESFMKKAKENGHHNDATKFPKEVRGTNFTKANLIKHLRFSKFHGAQVTNMAHHSSSEQRHLRRLSPLLDEAKGWFELGKEVWKVIKDGEAVADINTGDFISVVPTKDWQSMSQWKTQGTNFIPVAYHGGWDNRLCLFDYKHTFNFNGNYKNTGRYISNAQVLVDNVYVSWGNSLNVDAAKGDVVNVGTADWKIPQITMKLSWTCSNFVNTMKGTSTLQMSGNGNVQSL